ncbi:MAG: AAA family ATPase [Candidatus Poribacteria bacterium]|nr:AAA family ATPase [Candidatus Poribacteria bacterium]
MKTIAVLSRKGGTGKTTVAIHLAVAAEQAGHTTALIDLDPQASAASWRDIRENKSPAVISTHASRLAQTLHIAKDNGATLAIVDTAPHTESAALDAATAAEFAVIPCKPALIDLKAIGSTINIIRLANVPASIILNGVPARGNVATQARKAISHYDVTCAPCEIGSRIAFNYAYTAGLAVQEYEPRGKASGEIREFYAYIAKEMGV